MICQIVRFYGFSHNEIESMAYCDIEMYRAGMIKIRALETMDSMRIANYPNLRDESQKRVIDDLEKRSMIKENIKILTMDELAERLR